MSACLFILSHKAVKSADTSELEKILLNCKKVVDAFDWNNFKMCDFASDQASGYRHNIQLIEEELEQRKNGVDEPLDRPVISGYNPAVDYSDYPKRTGK